MAIALRNKVAKPNEEGLRMRASILAEVLAALLSVVLISAIGMGIFQERMTRAALSAEAERLTMSRLSVVGAAYEASEVSLALNLRELAERLNIMGYLDPARHNELEQLLGQTGSTLGIDILGAFGPGGEFIAGEGRFLEGTAVITGAIGPGLGTHLVAVPGGGFLRVLPTRLDLGGGVLVGGMAFSDGLAHQLRNRLGDRGEIILVADGKVVGSSLQLAGKLPGLDPETGELPKEPKVVTLHGERRLLVYESLGSMGSPSAAGAIGVAVPDPIAGLTERLGLVRWLSALALLVSALIMGRLLFGSVVRPLVDLSRTATRIAEGDLSVEFAAARNNEIGRLAQALQQMTAELQGKTKRLQEASKRLLLAQQEERQRVARDLHDGMQQQLVVLAVKLKQLAASEEPPNPLVLEHLAAEAEEAAFDLQDVGRGIFPTVLADQGVAAALRTSASRLPMPVRLEVAPELEESRFVPEVEGTLYFVAMEAMANAQKHASQAELSVSLRTRSGEGVILEVSDDGPGFEPSEVKFGAGLQNISDRVSAAGGTAFIEAAPESGVRVTVKIPLDSQTGARDPRN